MPKLLMERGREFSKYDREMLKLRWRESLNYGFCNHNVYSIWYRYWGKAKTRKKQNISLKNVRSILPGATTVKAGST